MRFFLFIWEFYNNFIIKKNNKIIKNECYIIFLSNSIDEGTNIYTNITWGANLNILNSTFILKQDNKKVSIYLTAIASKYMKLGYRR